MSKSEHEICLCCGRPIATEEDWASLREDEGEHLCWDEGRGCPRVSPEEALRRLLEYVQRCINTNTVPTLEGKNIALRGGPLGDYT